MFEKMKTSNFMKIPLLGAEFFHEDGRTDGRRVTTMLVVTYRNFANAPKYLELILKIIITICLYLFVSSIASCAYEIFG